MNVEPASLWSLLHPVTEYAFRSAYWQRAPLHRPVGGANPGMLLTIEEIDSVLHCAAANAAEFDFYRAGSALAQSHWTGPGNYVLLNRLLGLYAQGGTIHVSNIQKYSERVSRFCKAVQAQLLADCEADLWMTKRNDFQPYLHYDRYDIFALQIHGRKRWRLFRTLALAEGRTSAALSWEEVGPAVIDVVVEPGDLIYIPPHTPHVVTTVDAHSVHLGVGVHPLTWRQVLASALDASRLIPQSLDEVVPLDFMRDLRHAPRDAISESVRRMREAIELVEPERVAADLHRRFVEDVTHPRDRHFASEIFAPHDAVTATTPVARREGLFGRVGVDQGRAFLTYAGGGDLRGPAHYLKAFEKLLSGPAPLTANDLDPELPIEARVELVERAIEAGFCHRRTG